MLPSVLTLIQTIGCDGAICVTLILYLCVSELYRKEPYSVNNDLCNRVAVLEDMIVKTEASLLSAANVSYHWRAEASITGLLKYDHLATGWSA